MQLFRSRAFAVVIVVLLILGLAGAGIATLIPGRSQAPVVDAEALWVSQPDDVKAEVCTAFRANPQGYTLLMEQTWLEDGTLDQGTFDRLVDAIATDCRINY